MFFLENEAFMSQTENRLCLTDYAWILYSPQIGNKLKIVQLFVGVDKNMLKLKKKEKKK